CLRYEEPTQCFSKKRTHMRFCIDRYEWPNHEGELPIHLVSWLAATDKCAAAGKRLCNEHEFNFACEGEAMLPYTYGYVRDAEKCAIDKPYVMPDHSPQLRRYDGCQDDAFCRAEIGRLDQREPAGS